MVVRDGREQPIRLGGSVLGDARHICGFFNSEDEEYRVTLPFIKEGLDRGEKAFHVVSAREREEHLRRMASAGIDVSKAVDAGQFELRRWDDVYLEHGRFDQHGMLARWEGMFAADEREGFPLTRLLAHMEWALEEREGVSDLLEYEARFNMIHGPRKDPVICCYDLRRFPGDVVIDVLRTHPVTIMGGVLRENPFYVPPQQFLEELRVRRAQRAGSRPN